MGTTTTRIPQIEPLYGEAEIRAVQEYMRGGGWLTEHTCTRTFEDALASFVGVRHCVVMSSGTTSLVAALIAAGVGQGDEVIVPALTMVATANAVVLAGGIPTLADISDRHGCSDVDNISRALSERTKAVISVSLNGRSTDMAALTGWCRARGVLLVEDAAQSLGSRTMGRALGTCGTVGIYSFSPHKIITTGQGGAAVTDDDGISRRLRMVKDFGRRESGTDVHDIVGYNFKFTDLQAVVGLEQIKQIDARMSRKKAIFQRYRENLDGVVRFLDTDLNDTTPWFMDVLADNRDALRAHLTSEGIGTRAFYPPIHAQPAYRDRFGAESPGGQGALPIAEKIAGEGLWLPSSLRLTDADVDRVCASVRAFYSR
jgi:perosamine synthetase